MLSPCSFCSADCCKNHYITVTAFDIARLSEKLGKKAEEFAVLYPLKLINYDNDTVLEMQEEGCTMEYVLCLKSHPCLFLEKNRCTIHDFSPSVCRMYPKQINGNYNFGFCPIPSKMVFRMTGINMKNDFIAELEVYKKIVAEWNKKKGKKKDCLGFLVERAHQLGQESL